MNERSVHTSDNPEQPSFQERLHYLLDYDPCTGVFTWKNPPSRRVKRGQVAGYKTPKGYLQIRVDNVLYMAHHLAVIYVYGKFDKAELDHINGVKNDNRILNLRCVTALAQNRNLPIKSTNKSGYNGVSWYQPSKKWRASITVDYQTLYLGTFSALEDAVKARQEANIKYGFHPNHGRTPT